MKKMNSTRLNSENERIKRAYYRFLEQAAGRARVSVDMVASAIDRFETFTGHVPFSKFETEQAVKFKKILLEEVSPRTGRILSKATARTILLNLKAFFAWLGGQPGYRSRISYGDADYFNMSEKELRVANARRERKVPAPAEIKRLLELMPCHTPIELRNRAVVAFSYLTGTRVAATASLKLKHVDLNEKRVYQDAREVNTKFSKSIYTWFFPVDPIALQIVRHWVGILREELGFGDDYPLFPATLISGGKEQKFTVRGLSRNHWADTAAIRKIFRNAFEAAGLEYSNPHTMRNALARLGEQICQNAEEMYAWAQNLGHESLLTTFQSYGSVPLHRRGQIFEVLAARAASGPSKGFTREQMEAVRAFQKAFPELP